MAEFGGKRHRRSQNHDCSDASERAREICLRRLAIRPHTRAELENVLRRHSIDDAVATEVLDRYTEVGIVDDKAFARAWVTSRHQSRGLARRSLGRELRHKGVDEETVTEVLGEVDSSMEEATARSLVIRKVRSQKRDSPDVLLRRLVGMLTRRGYSSLLAIQVVKEVLAEEAEDGELSQARAFLDLINDDIG